MTTIGADRRARLSLLWVFVMLNMLLADVLSFLSADTLKDVLAGHAGQIAITPGFLLLAAVLTEIPIAMVVLSLVLPQRAARWANVIAGAFTIVYIWGLGSVTPHYVFIAAVETVGCLLIVWSAWTWHRADARVPARLLVTE
jgi:hypothetical protein